MLAAVSCWIGVDVGGPRKGFDVAVLDDEPRLRGLHRGGGLVATVRLIEELSPLVVGIDSPGHCAPPGATARADERELSRRVCRIRWTPDEAAVRASPYYEWAVAGLELFAALRVRGFDPVEVFPTASFTRWLGPRGKRSRAEWTSGGMKALSLAGLPARTNQDQRDAIAAALTARQHSRGETEAIGAIVVPRG
jgi:predicted nuclease with RNAse H fold